MIYGYARVSTEDQDNSRQVDDLLKFGCTQIFEEKISGAKRIRPVLTELLSILKPGDMVVVLKLDRLGRSLGHLIELIEGFKRNKIEFKSLGDAIDTTTPQGIFTLQMIGAFAEFERNMISERIRHGMANKKANGAKFGRPKIDYTIEFNQINELRMNKIKPPEIMLNLGLTKEKYYRIINSQIGNNPIMG